MDLYKDICHELSLSYTQRAAQDRLHRRQAYLMTAFLTAVVGTAFGAAIWDTNVRRDAPTETICPKPTQNVGTHGAENRPVLNH